MVFTHCTPSCLPHEAVLADSLQICSIKVAKIKHLEWPLHVYGLIAARDYVDHKCNILFYRPRSRSQTLTKNDPYLHLTGPRRALLAIDNVHIEIQLRVKGHSKLEDRPLITQAFRYYNGSNRDWFYSYLFNYLCKIQLCFEQLKRSCQATVLAVRVTRGSPFKYGGQVVCCASPYEDNDPNKEIVLFDSKYGVMDSDGTMSMDPDGYLDLSRRVVSVQGRLKIFIHTYSRSGAIRASGRISFRAKDCQTSQAKCFLHKRSKASRGNSAASEGKDQVKINVAWSRFARKISAIELDCFGDLF
ncbi:uncharacterized protein [Lolium perenne]|uniref:uncharacterized protein n=1 Tax=Lolium perenne TaxID=4522 RepID=UPI003A98F937